MGLPAFLGKIIGWLRVGYPDGVPATDYIPLFALLSSQLTDQELTDVAAELASQSDEDTSRAVSEARAAVTEHHATSADLARVRARLAAGGWPLARPDRPGPGECG